MKEILTEEEIMWAYEQWCHGYSKPEIALALHVSLSTLKRIFTQRNLKKIKPPLIPPKN